MGPWILVLASLAAGQSPPKRAPIGPSVLGHARPVASPDGRLLAVGCDDGTVRIVDLERGEQTGMHANHAGRVRILAWGPQERLASAGPNGEVVVLDLATGASRSRSDGAGEFKWSMQIPSFEFQPGGERLLVSLGSHASVWKLAPPESLERIDLGVIVEHAAWGPDGALAAGGSDGSIVVWNRDLDRIAELRTTPPVRFVAFDPSGRRLVSSGSVDLVAVVWNLETLEPMLRLKHPGWADWKDFISSARFSVDGQRLVTTTSTWASVAVWNACSGERLWSVDYGGNPLRNDASFDSRGGHVFVRGFTHRIVDADTGEDVTAPENPGVWLGATPAGRFAVLRRGDGIEVRDGETLWPLFTYVPCEAGAWRLDRHPPPDGRR